MKAVFQRELRALMHSAPGWLVICAVPAAFAVMAALHLVSGSAADFIRVIMDSTVAFWLVAPVYAAGGFAADRKTGADKLMHALPVKPAAFVAGRYLAWCVPFLAGVLISSLYPVALGFFAQIPVLQTVGGMIVYAFAGMSVIAATLYISRMTSSTAANAIIALVIMAICHFLPDIAGKFVAWGVSYWLALLVIALIALFFGWKATRSIVTALVFAIVAEAAGLLVLGGTPGTQFWNGLCNMVNIQLHFNALFIGVMKLADLVHFPLLSLLLVMLSAQGWRMEPFMQRRDA